MPVIRDAVIFPLCSLDETTPLAKDAIYSAARDALLCSAPGSSVRYTAAHEAIRQKKHIAIDTEHDNRYVLILYLLSETGIKKPPQTFLLNVMRRL